jgi:site-specific DNA recombinase
MSDEAPRVLCGIYTRQSRDRSTEFSSCEAQFSECKRFTWGRIRDGWIWNCKHYDDEGRSGESLDRPALQRLLDDIDRGEVERVIVHRLDRLSRSLRDCMELLQVLRDREVPLTIVTAPELNATADHAFVLNILAAFAEFEREMIRSRLAESRAALKAKGRRVAGNVPYGFRADPDTKQLILQPNEAERVREMFVMAGEGLTPRQIAETVNRRKWLTSRGRSWTARQVTTTLTNGAYAGRIQNGDISRRGVHEAIVDEQLFAQVGSLIETRRTRPAGRKTPAANWLLRGRLYCGGCGRLMSPSPSQRKNIVYRYYRCRSDAGGRPPCHGTGVPAFQIEKFVLDRVANEQLWKDHARERRELQGKWEIIKASLPLLSEPKQEAFLAKLVERVVYDADKGTIQIDLDVQALENVTVSFSKS